MYILYLEKECSYVHGNCLGEEKFTDREIQKFKTRYENKYDIKTDKRYNKWLELYHPEDLFCKSGKQPLL